MAYEVKDQVALITGAATGIGAEVARCLLEEKAKHVAILDISQENGIALQNELNSKYGANKVKFYKCDVTNDDELFAAFESVAKDQGYIDVVINNAGIMNDSKRLYKKSIDVNVTALITGTLKALEIMRKDQGGRGGTVVNISSVAGITQVPDMPIYWATKSAVLQFSNCIGLEGQYQRTGVRVLAICFGATKTALLSESALGSFDENVGNAALMKSLVCDFPVQSVESAARGLVEAYKQGKSASTWLVNSDKPAMDITDNIKKAYDIMSENVFC